MRDGSPGHVNVLIHWGVYGNSTFRLHARGLETRPLETDPPGEREIERGRGETLWIRRRCFTHGRMSLRVLLRRRPLDSEFVSDLYSSPLPQECSPGRSVSSRARTQPHSITRSVSPSSTRARTSALEQSIYPREYILRDDGRSGKCRGFIWGYYASMIFWYR